MWWVMLEGEVRGAGFISLGEVRRAVTLVLGGVLLQAHFCGI